MSSSSSSSSLPPTILVPDWENHRSDFNTQLFTCLHFLARDIHHANDIVFKMGVPNYTVEINETLASLSCAIKKIDVLTQIANGEIERLRKKRKHEEIATAAPNQEEETEWEEEGEAAAAAAEVVSNNVHVPPPPTTTSISLSKNERRKREKAKTIEDIFQKAKACTYEGCGIYRLCQPCLGYKRQKKNGGVLCHHGFCKEKMASGFNYCDQHKYAEDRTCQSKYLCIKHNTGISPFCDLHNC